MYNAPLNLSDNSRIWIYQADRELTADEQSFLNQELLNFITDWTAHNVALSGSFEILHDRFLVIMIDENKTSASGCSIDKCFNFLKKMEAKLNVNFMNRLLLAYKENNEIKMLPKSKFEDLLKAGQLNENTIVFNNLIEKKAELKTNWQVPIKDSWHKVML
ncbi:MAG TPA: ABC transporter ATPase [Bacteroidia bacterium]|nr:ABC transporter ATPase [Bacteroidota bacterium]MBK7573128.1 ABC transporter ATPase [Bacteroidota bacterium]MBP9923997.1 ABC transporter ATPase [Bacteroidia bacterium]HQV99898.1 ABC transporter ATPase [Bacteroidia bacterium]HQW22197.1 ABC transporter ATPase [Bacteroidia bacterium]